MHSQRTTVVALFTDFLQAQAAVRTLQQGGFDMGKLSIIGKNYHREEHVTGVIDDGDGARYWGRFGGLWAGLPARRRRSAVLQFPGVGQVVILGPLVSNVAGILADAGTRALTGTLATLGLARDSVLHYESEVRAGRFAMMMQGNPEDARAAHRLLEAAGAMEVRDHCGA
jgi:hypothetical protein